MAGHEGGDGMTGTFACPECGDEVTLKGATPGREVQCSRCATWVEVPFLPRDGVWTRPRFRKARGRWVIPLAWAGVGLLAIVVAIVAGSHYLASQGRSSREAVVAEFLHAADAAEKSGRADRALSEVEAALAFLEPTEPAGSPRSIELRRRRDGLSIREAEARLAASPGMEASTAVGSLLSLQARARTDRALDGLTSTIHDAIDRARRRQVEADLAAARKASDDGRSFDALTLGERALVVADKLDAVSSHAVIAEAELILGPIVSRIGAIVVQRPGQFSLGSGESYDKLLGPVLTDALRRQGFAPRPSRGPARGLWDRHARYRLEFHLAESQGAIYLQSKNHTSEIAASLALINGDQTVWQTQVIGRTQVPLPNLAAYVGSRMAVSDHRSPESERLLHENARSVLLEQVAQRIRVLPAP
jgi:hypothetical protein